jgi:hypothetical protein
MENLKVVDDKTKKKLKDQVVQIPEGFNLGQSEPGQIVTLLCAAASGSTAINYLAQDPDLAEKEASVILEATRKSKK